MRSITILSFMMFLLLLFVGCVTDGSDILNEEQIVKIEQDDWKALPVENFRIYNNVWGKEDVTQYRQEIFTYAKDGMEGFGWRWSWPQKNRVLAYPEIIYGASPWDPDSFRTDQFPRKLNDGPVTVRYETEMDVTQKCNLALEYWLCSSEIPSDQTLTHEVMIWQMNRSMTPAGSIIGTFKHQGVLYSVYVRNHHDPGAGSNVSGWTYIAFVPSVDNLQGELHLDEFNNYLIEKGIIGNENLTMCGVEMGTEIVGGRGTMLFREFTVEADPAP